MRGFTLLRAFTEIARLGLPIVANIIEIAVDALLAAHPRPTTELVRNSVLELVRIIGGDLPSKIPVLHRPARVMLPAMTQNEASGLRMDRMAMKHVLAGKKIGATP